MKTFWIVIGVLVGICCAMFVTGSITANVKGYDNVVEWVKDWSVFEDEAEQETQEEILDENLNSEVA